MTTTDWDVYCAFRQAQADFLSRPYKLPKNWEKFKKRLTQKNLDCLEQVTKKFNGTWYKICPHTYFRTGFNIFGKKFSYVKFFEKVVLKKYMQDDRLQKRNMNLSKKELINSVKFIRKYMSRKRTNPRVSLVRQYSALAEGQASLPIIHYIKGHLDKFFLVWLMRRGLVKVTDDERAQIPDIVDNYREYLAVLDKPGMSNFLEKLRELI